MAIRPTDEPGFLSGAGGVALALTDHFDLPSTADTINWDCLLNLS